MRARYYLAHPDGTVSSLGNKKLRAEALGDRYSEVQKFQISNQLQWDNPHDLAEIIAHFGQLED